MDVDPDDDSATEGPLAEYVAMRAEILHCSQHMSALFNLLIASNGVILGVVLRGQVVPSTPSAGRANGGSSLMVLLVLPVISYLVSVRYVYLHVGAVRIGHYIDDALRARIPGGIGWETYLRNMKKNYPDISQRWSDYIAFLGTSVLGLTGSAYALLTGGASAWFWAPWCGCAGLTTLTFLSIRFGARTRRALDVAPS
jgi:hypothetical protein